jgi:phosphoglycerol transferase MdoB-like AlkP superfamily enzyme
MSGSDTHMINLWKLNLICHFIAFGIILLLLWFGIYLHLVIANKILTNL